MVFRLKWTGCDPHATAPGLFPIDLNSHRWYKFSMVVRSDFLSVVNTVAFGLPLNEETIHLQVLTSYQCSFLGR